LENNHPLVTAVITTRNRPDLVLRAVESVLAQTYSTFEVVVVIDGCDLETEAALASIPDPRLRVIALAHNMGASEARNIGARLCRGEWIALLDDDDEWVPVKLAEQLNLALRSKYRLPIVSSRFVCHTPQADYIWPRRLYASGGPICEYLLTRHSLFQGEGMMATSTLLVRREMLLEVPFRRLQKHQDWDWVLRAATQPGAGVEFCEKPLIIRYVEEHRPSISNAHDWRFSLSWARDMRCFMTARAYAGFLLTVVAAQAARVSSLNEYLGVLKEALRHGSPSALNLVLFLGMVAVPREARHKLRALLCRNAV
jgi:glycosyltransferase involved in cell wall biosynthesis